MDKELEVPEKRFQDYQEIFDTQGIPIGFTLPGSQFLFKYDSHGGWRDQKGNYYNSKGILQILADQHSEEDEEDLDEQQIDQFQRMLDDQNEQKQKKQAKQKNQQKSQKQPETYQTETKSLLQKYSKKQSIREGLPEQLHIYFKMRTKYYQRIKPTVEKTQSIAQSNVQIAKIKDQALSDGKKFRAKYKWLENAGQFEYSGTHLDEATYDRYWYGFIKANPQNYQQIIQQIQKSQEFALLQLKTYYSLKSKFYLKKKMQQTIKQLKEKLQGDDNSLFRIQINNLPQNFPCSFIFDLLTYSGTPIEEVFRINIVDAFTCDLLISKKGAEKFINVQGYSHDDKQYIELNVQVDKEKRKLKGSEFFKVGVTKSKDNPYKPHTRQLFDTLALIKGREEFVKLFSESQQKENGQFRFIVNKNVLKRVLMFRGFSMDVLRIQVFQK